MAKDKTRWNAGRASRKRTRLAVIKLEAGCCDCGYNESSVALDFDHRDGEEKLFTLTGDKLAGISWERIEAEIAKCDIRCANCHRIRTHE